MVAGEHRRVEDGSNFGLSIAARSREVTLPNLSATVIEKYPSRHAIVNVTRLGNLRQTTKVQMSAHRRVVNGSSFEHSIAALSNDQPPSWQTATTTEPTCYPGLGAGILALGMLVVCTIAATSISTTARAKWAAMIRGWTCVFRGGNASRAIATMRAEDVRAQRPSSDGRARRLAAHALSWLASRSTWACAWKAGWKQQGCSRCEGVLRTTIGGPTNQQPNPIDAARSSEPSTPAVTPLPPRQPDVSRCERPHDNISTTATATIGKVENLAHFLPHLYAGHSEEISQPPCAVDMGMLNLLGSTTSTSRSTSTVTSQECSPNMTLVDESASKQKRVLRLAAPDLEPNMQTLPPLGFVNAVGDAGLDESSVCVSKHPVAHRQHGSLRHSSSDDHLSSKSDCAEVPYTVTKTKLGKIYDLRTGSHRAAGRARKQPNEWYGDIDRTKARDFLDTFNQIAIFNGWTNKECCDAFPMRLKSRATPWYQTTLTQHERSNWLALQAHFLERYSTASINDKDETAVYDIKQGDRESFAEYKERTMHAVSRMTAPIRQPKLVQLLISHSEPKTQEEIGRWLTSSGASVEDTDPEDLVRYVQALENIRLNADRNQHRGQMEEQEPSLLAATQPSTAQRRRPQALGATTPKTLIGDGGRRTVLPNTPSENERRQEALCDRVQQLEHDLEVCRHENHRLYSKYEPHGKPNRVIKSHQRIAPPPSSRPAHTPCQLVGNVDVVSSLTARAYALPAEQAKQRTKKSRERYLARHGHAGTRRALARLIVKQACSTEDKTIDMLVLLKHIKTNADATIREQAESTYDQWTHYANWVRDEVQPRMSWWTDITRVQNRSTLSHALPPKARGKIDEIGERAMKAQELHDKLQQLWVKTKQKQGLGKSTSNNDHPQLN